MVQFIKMATSRYTITIYSHNQDIQYALNDQKEFEEFQLSTTALRGMHKNYSDVWAGGTWSLQLGLLRMHLFKTTANKTFLKK